MGNLHLPVVHGCAAAIYRTFGRPLWPSADVPIGHYCLCDRSTCCIIGAESRRAVGSPRGPRFRCSHSDPANDGCYQPHLPPRRPRTGTWRMGCCRIRCLTSRTSTRWNYHQHLWLARRLCTAPAIRHCCIGAVCSVGAAAADVCTEHRQAKRRGDLGRYGLCGYRHSTRPGLGLAVVDFCPTYRRYWLDCLVRAAASHGE